MNSALNALSRTNWTPVYLLFFHCLFDVVLFIQCEVPDAAISLIGQSKQFLTPRHYNELLSARVMDGPMLENRSIVRDISEAYNPVPLFDDRHYNFDDMQQNVGLAPNDDSRKQKHAQIPPGDLQMMFRQQDHDFRPTADIRQIISLNLVVPSDVANDSQLHVAKDHQLKQRDALRSNYYAGVDSIKANMTGLKLPTSPAEYINKGKEFLGTPAALQNAHEDIRLKAQHRHRPYSEANEFPERGSEPSAAKPASPLMGFPAVADKVKEDFKKDVNVIETSVIQNGNHTNLKNGYIFEVKSVPSPDWPDLKVGYGNPREVESLFPLKSHVIQSSHDFVKNILLGYQPVPESQYSGLKELAQPKTLNGIEGRDAQVPQVELLVNNSEPQIDDDIMRMNENLSFVDTSDSDNDLNSGRRTDGTGSGVAAGQDLLPQLGPESQPKGNGFEATPMPQYVETSAVVPPERPESAWKVAPYSMETLKTLRSNTIFTAGGVALIGVLAFTVVTATKFVGRERNLPLLEQEKIEKFKV